MEWLSRIILILLVSQLYSLPMYAQTSPVGYWKAIDRSTAKTKTIIQIWQAEDHTLMGKVIKVFPKQGQNQVGRVILSGLKGANYHWNQGRMVNLENGKTYNCSLHLADNGKQLNVHGFAGLPFFGNSQTWERVDLMAIE